MHSLLSYNTTCVQYRVYAADAYLRVSFAHTSSLWTICHQPQHRITFYQPNCLSTSCWQAFCQPKACAERMLHYKLTPFLAAHIHTIELP
jgi:hypothetical protein